MKRFVKNLFVALLMAVAIPSCNMEDLQNLQQQIDELKSNQIASIDTQVASIKASIGNLETTETELRGYIKTLQDQQAVLTEEDQKLAKAIADAKAALSGEISEVEAGLIAQLEAYKATVASQIVALNTAIENLQTKDAALQAQIIELKDYTDKEIKNTKDWASATFVTLEKYNTTTAQIGTIQSQISSINTQMEGFQTALSDAMAQIIQLKADLQQSIADHNTALSQAADAITAAYTTAIASAIATSEASLKNWVNEQLTGYYTAVQTDAKLAALQAEQEQKLNQQKLYVETLLANLKTVLESKISSNSALIEGLQGQVSSLSAEAASLACGILNNADSVAVNAAQINANAQAIAQTSSDSAACETRIAANKELIAVNARAITANDTAIEALQALVATSEQGIANNVKNIAKNAADIAVNANLIAANATAISNNTTAIADNAAAIAQLRTDLQTTMADLTIGYQNAVKTAIQTLDGKLSGEIAEQVTSLNTRITQEVEAINTAITALQTRVTACEEEIVDIKTTIANIQETLAALRAQVGELLSRIQSVSYVPRYEDSKATMAYLESEGVYQGVAILDFKIKPSGTAAQLAEVWQNALSAEVVYTHTRVNEMDTLPVVGIEVSGDVLTVAIDGSKLSQTFFTGAQKASVALVISDGNNDRTSDYVPIVPQAALSGLSITADEDCEVSVSGVLHKDLLDNCAAYFLYGSADATLEEILINGDNITITPNTSGNYSINIITPIGNYKSVIKIQVGSIILLSGTLSFNNIPGPVDMGLSVKWSTFNVGALHPEEVGGFYAWGEKNEKDYYSNSNYSLKNTYKSGRKIMKPEDDVARQNLVDLWRMPTIQEFDELKNEDNCTWEWTTRNGLYGYLVTSKITGNSIYLPAVGKKGANGMVEPGTEGIYGMYWSSSLREEYRNLAWVLTFNSMERHPGYNEFRWYGQQVRPVYGYMIHVESISLNTKALFLTVENGESILSATVSPANAHETGYSWTSSNPSIVKVNQEGVVTPVSTGSATITVTSVDGGFTDECLVTVGEPAVPEAVDMGLNVKWASWNVGTYCPEGFGSYFSWGEIETKDYYHWETYKWCNGSETTMFKYCKENKWGTIDNKSILETEDDVAAVTLGGNWRMPTSEEWIELLNEETCTWSWTTRNHVDGYLVTSKITGNSIFLPAAGARYFDEINRVGEEGYYWSSTLYPGASRSAWQVSIKNHDDHLSHRYNGISVRPVCPE